MKLSEADYRAFADRIVRQLSEAGFLRQGAHSMDMVETVTASLKEIFATEDEDS